MAGILEIELSAQEELRRREGYGELKLPPAPFWKPPQVIPVGHSDAAGVQVFMAKNR